MKPADDTPTKHVLRGLRRLRILMGTMVLMTVVLLRVLGVV
jgi:hypothetical protein